MTCHANRYGAVSLLIVCACWTGVVSADDAGIARVHLKSGATIVGRVEKQSESGVSIWNWATDERMDIAAPDLERIDTTFTESQAIAVIGLPRFVGRNIQASIPSTIRGKVAHIDGPIIYLNLGQEAGLRKLDRFRVLRGEQEIRDPDTGAVIGTVNPKIADLEVTQVDDRTAKARRTDGSELAVKVGDVVAPIESGRAIGIGLLVAQDGSTDSQGGEIMDGITAVLVKAGIPVVERQRLVAVLTELAVQQTALFDTETTRKVGRQAGARFLVMGTLRSVPQPSNQLRQMDVRLVDVESGVVLYALSTRIKAIPNAKELWATDDMAKEKLRAELKDSRWGSYTWHADGRVSHPQWREVGHWTVSDGKSVIQQNPVHAQDRFKITFSPDMKMSYWEYMSDDPVKQEKYRMVQRRTR